MSQLTDLEEAIRGAVAGVEWDGRAAFAEVVGFGGAFGRAMGEYVRRLRKPAAVVNYLGQEGVGQRWAVVIASQGLRGGGEGRLGGEDVAGIFELVHLVRGALDGRVVGSGDRLGLLEERLVEADERVVIGQQVYGAERALGQPTFDGKVICGSVSEVAVVPGAVAREVVEFAFAGIDGVYRHDLGARGRPIVWQGQLRGSDEAELNAIESELEGYAVDPREYRMVDGAGRTFEYCVLERFERTGPRRVEPVSAWATQGFRLVFQQLDVA